MLHVVTRRIDPSLSIIESVMDELTPTKRHGERRERCQATTVIEHGDATLLGEDGLCRRTVLFPTLVRIMYRNGTLERYSECRVGCYEGTPNAGITGERWRVVDRALLPHRVY